MKIVLIHLIIKFRIVENTRLKNYNYIKFIRILIRTVNITISDESMNLFDLNEKLTVARQRGFIFNQVNKLTRKIYSNLQSINIHYYI